MSNNTTIRSSTLDGISHCDKGHLMYKGAFVNGSFDVSFCINLLDDRRSWRVALGIWSIIVTIVGVIGNIFTLLAIPYAAQRQRYILEYLPTYHCIKLELKRGYTNMKCYTSLDLV